MVIQHARSAVNLCLVASLILLLTLLQVAAQDPTASQSGQRLGVLVGKSLVLTSPESLGRVSVTDPEIASAIIITDTQILINGLKPGSITLLLWNQQEQVQSFDLDVMLDVEGFREALGRTFPTEKIEVRQTGAALTLSGEVGSEQAVTQIQALAQSYSPQIVNLLRVKQNRDIVLLKVKIAEVDRSALTELGVSLFSTGLGNTIGGISTQQFGSLGASAGAIPNRVQPPAQGNPVAGVVGQGNEAFPSVFGLSDLLNIFLFRPDINLGAVVRALNQRNLLQILAEPNILALNGKEASFLAGGEFPFPVIQGGSNVGAVTIEFREFGVRVNFTPTILDDGLIRLKVTPEVSALDFANSLTISGFVVPAITTRRTETEVELKDGQSFAISGLIDNRVVEVASKIPGLGDIPFLGNLFKSRSSEKSNTELLVMVTPQLVKALDPGQLPEVSFPKEFMVPEAFDAQGKKKPAGDNP